MKRIILLPLLLLSLLTSCSGDDTMMQAENNTAARIDGGIPDPCFASVNAYSNIDVTNGLGNPIVEFISQSVGAPRKTYYNVSLQVQAISDCENMASDAGPSIQFPGGQVVQADVAPVTIALSPSQLPSTCYKWRMVYYKSPDGKSYNGCMTASEWFEAPLF